MAAVAFIFMIIAIVLQSAGGAPLISQDTNLIMDEDAENNGTQKSSLLEDGLFEGDIAITEDLIHLHYNFSSIPGGEKYMTHKDETTEGGEGISKRAAVRSNLRLWTNRIVPYKFSTSIQTFGRPLTTRSAIDQLSLVTQYAGMGYNVLQASPEGDFNRGGIDPGIKTTRFVFKHTYNGGKRAFYRGRAMSVPDQVEFHMTQACSRRETTNAYSGQTSYKNELSVNVESSGKCMSNIVAIAPVYCCCLLFVFLILQQVMNSSSLLTLR